MRNQRWSQGSSPLGLKKSACCFTSADSGWNEREPWSFLTSGKTDGPPAEPTCCDTVYWRHILIRLLGGKNRLVIGKCKSADTHSSWITHTHTPRCNESFWFWNPHLQTLAVKGIIVIHLKKIALQNMQKASFKPVRIYLVCTTKLQLQCCNGVFI